REHLKRIVWRSVYANFEVQHWRALRSCAHRRDALPCLDEIALSHHDRLRMPISAQKRFVVLDNDKLAIAEQTRARVHDTAVRCGAHCIAKLATDRQTIAAVRTRGQRRCTTAHRPQP